MINYSIIIPHKNTPDLLRKCINSIPDRDDVQIIVIDDNSDKDKVDFDNFPGKNNPKVEVYFTKEGKGGGYARNIGLAHANGKWLIFADADDFFYESLNLAMDQFKDDASDVVFFKGGSEYLQSHHLAHRSDLFNERVDFALMTGNFQPILFYSSPWIKFINRVFVLDNHIAFNEVMRGNDIVFMAMIAAKIQSCKASELVIYCLTINENSLVSYNMILYEAMTRLDEDLKAVHILKKRYKIEHDNAYWYYESWFNVYKLNKWKAITYMPKIMHALGPIFIYELFLSILRKIRYTIKRM